MNLGVTAATDAEKIAYLRTLPAIRQRCAEVHALAEENRLHYFEYHPDREADVVEYCASIMNVRTRAGEG